MVAARMRFDFVLRRGQGYSRHRAGRSKAPAAGSRRQVLVKRAIVKRAHQRYGSKECVTMIFPRPLISTGERKARARAIPHASRILCSMVLLAGSGMLFPGSGFATVENSRFESSADGASVDFEL